MPDKGVTGTEKVMKESTMLREENLQQYAKKIADQHNLMLMPQPLDKPQLYQMWKKEKGSFGSKAGVMTFVPNTKTVNVLSNDEKVPEAVFLQFKADKGGNDQGFETKTFAEDGAKGYFKNFSITDINEGSAHSRIREYVKAQLKKEIVQIKDEDGEVVKLAADKSKAQDFVNSQDAAVKSKLKVTGQ
jgi:hypothetical protein